MRSSQAEHAGALLCPRLRPRNHDGGFAQSRRCRMSPVSSHTNALTAVMSRPSFNGPSKASRVYFLKHRMSTGIDVAHQSRLGARLQRWCAAAKAAAVSVHGGPHSRDLKVQASEN